MFLEMWNYIINSTEDYEKFRPDADYVAKIPSVGYVQPYSDTPLDHENTGENVYMNIINSAQKYVYIFTPYLIIDHEMLVSLQNAAKRGVDVRIITPHIPDKKHIKYMTEYNYGILLKNGIRIYEYEPGFIHSKVVMNEHCAIVGTINMDYRSLYHHFENGVWMHGCDAIRDIEADFDKLLQDSEEVTDKYRDGRKNMAVRGWQCIMRLIAPLL